MSINHIATNHPVHGKVPLCGRADWDELVEPDSTDDPAGNECWECASIAGVDPPFAESSGITVVGTTDDPWGD